MPQIKLIYMNILFPLVANRCSYYFFIQSYCRDKVPSFLKFSPQKFLDLPPTFLAIAMELIPLIKKNVFDVQKVKLLMVKEISNVPLALLVIILMKIILNALNAQMDISLKKILINVYLVR